ncbi:efflux RND transporter permease subunit [Saccharicrinis sp. GN24d3]|uniref:efflux RND transporter permease subunit n=1 Tax=Saccharicrinis sp. GN24d3 TaxID=3458416 RepID=UPI00403595B7
MINNIIRFSLNNKFLILLGSVVLVVFGLRTATNMDIDVFPDLTAPTVIVMTDAHGMAPEEVERLVTYPIETAVNGAMDVRRVRSTSALGFSFVWVDFDWGTDVYKARQVVSEKLMTVQEVIPENVAKPILAPQSSVMGEILFLSLQADSTDLTTLRTIAEWNLQPQILATGGVSQVTIVGGDYKQYQVLADPMKMNYYDVSVQELADACKEMSQNSSGKIVREYGNEYVVRGMARTSKIDDLGNTYIKSVNGNPVRVNDVAEVKLGSAVKMGYAAHNAKPAIIISVSKQPNTNTLAVTENIEKKIESIKATLPPDVTVNTKIFRQADFIETSVNNVQKALLEGAALVIIILFLFLGSFRTTIISLLAIPLSLLGSVIVLQLLGLNINTMSLGGMAIAIGSLVDDAIIDVENVYKRLKQNFKIPPGDRQNSFTVVYEASKEIRASILNATLIIIVAFMPLFFLSGMEGRMLKPLGIAYIVSLFMSLLIAMTLTPLLAKMMLSGDKYLSGRDKDSWLAGKLAKGYEKSLKWVLGHKKWVVLPVMGLFIISLVMFSRLGRTFLPEFNEGALTLSVVIKPGTSLEESNRVGNLVENEMLSIPHVTSTARRTGRGELDTHSQSTNSAEIDVNFSLKERELEDFLREVRAKLSSIPGIAYTVGQPLGHRIDHMLSGTRANIAIKLFGTDLNRMFTIGNQIKSDIIDIEGLVDVSVEQQVEIPQIQIRANRNMLSFYGISIHEFNAFIDIALGGEKVADIYEGQKTFDLILRFSTDYTDKISGIMDALIDTYDGRKIPLSEVAEIVSATGPNSISRENVQRKLVISANVAERDLRGVVEDIQNNINNNIKLPENYYIQYGGQFESEQKASRMLMLTSIAAIFIIFMLLYQEFKNFNLAAIILLNLPLALIGGIIAVVITSGMLSIPAIIGFITLFGIATRNGILLVSRYQHLQQEGERLYETLIHGSKDRLLPILMTALTAALALIPLAMNGDKPGNEIQSPMAQVILGGLLTSTILNIYIVPMVYQFFNNKGLIKNESK